MLEEARADLLSSSMSFQVVADEIRSGQLAAEKKWGGEVRQLKEQMSTNQKRLFLLEQEKEQLQKTASSAESETKQLRRSVASMAGENAALREQQSRLEAQVRWVGCGGGRLARVARWRYDMLCPLRLISCPSTPPRPRSVWQIAALRDVVAVHLGGGAEAGGSGEGGGALPDARPAVGGSVGPMVSTPTQTESEAEEMARLEMARWQQQLSKMSEWLRTGAQLLDHSPAAPPSLPPSLPAAVPEQASSTEGRWSDS